MVTTNGPIAKPRKLMQAGGCLTLIAASALLLAGAYWIQGATLGSVANWLGVIAAVVGVGLFLVARIGEWWSS